MIIAGTVQFGSSEAHAQEGGLPRTTLSMEKKLLEKVLERLSKQTGYQFFYNSSLIKDIRVSISLENASIHETMKTLLAGTGLQYTIKGKMIVITTIPQKEMKQEILGGRVSDSSGGAIPGVSIFTQDQKQGAVSDIDGRYKFNYPIEYGTLLTFSSVGMKSRIIVYSGETSLQVVLTEDVQQLPDVVVTGFQTISRERSTGSATIIKQEMLDKIKAPNLGSKLEALSPGLTTYNGSMSIRGISSFAVNSTPLLVLDGQPITGVSINELNPDDIESVTVLKDAAATSLYGVRASNGVIVVSTKRGVTKKPQINISANYYMNPTPSLDYLHYASTSEIIDYEQAYLLNHPDYKSSPIAYLENLSDKSAPKYLTQLNRLYYQAAKGEISGTQLNSSLDELRKNDYRRTSREALQQLSFTQDYNVSIAKASDKSNLFFSARYENRGTNIKSNESDKFTFYLKNELELTSWFNLTLGANVALGNSLSNGAEYQGNTSAMPYDILYNIDGSLAYRYPYNYLLSQVLNQTKGLNFMGYNAVEESTKNMQESDDVYWKMFTHAEFKLAKGLNFGVKFQYEDRLQNSERYDEEESYYMRNLINKFTSNNPKGGFVYNIPQGGRLHASNARWSYLNLRGQFDYATVIADKHDFTALLGGEIREDNYRSKVSERYGYDEQKLTYQQVDWATLSRTGVVGQLSNTANVTSEMLGISDMKHRYVSAYFNAGYSYDTRYAVNASVRVEQADLFGTDPKYRYRPLWSLGASWNISNEKFMKEIAWVNMLKFRLTYGITGNVDQSSSPYLLGSYITSPDSGANLTSINTPPNKMLRWEKTSTLNLGLDFILLKRISGSLDFYNRYSSDLLANKSLDPSSGFVEARINNGAMTNSGVELNLSYDWLKSKDWQLTTNLTAAYNKNKIREVGYLPTDAVNMMRSPSSYYLKGDVYNSLYAYRYAGLTSAGNPSVYDAAGNAVSLEPMRDINALTCMGQLTPKWNGGLDLTLRWKPLTLFAKIVYYTGHALRVDATPLYNGVSSVMGAVHEDVTNRWTPENIHTDIPSMTMYGLQSERENHWKLSDYNTASASFLKVRNIGLSYTLPQQWLSRAGIKGASLRAQVDNPFYWAANKRDIDPEAFSANSGTRTSEKVTSYVMGVNVNF